MRNASGVPQPRRRAATKQREPAMARKSEQEMRPGSRGSAQGMQSNGKRSVASTYRKGAQNSEVRQRLVENARQIIHEEGCSAVTAGRLARQVGLGRPTVHYYFGTIEELFVAVIRHDGDEVRKWLTEALRTGNPLRVIWNPAQELAPLTFELIAMAIRSEAIRAETRRYTELFRDMLTEAIERYLADRNMKTNVPPIAIGLVVQGLSQALAGDSACGVSTGHKETEALVQRWIKTFEQTGLWPEGGLGAI
jgi:AcrR family transcriptional regulator